MTAAMAEVHAAGAACAGKPPDWWLGSGTVQTELAKGVCAGCPARRACLRATLEVEGEQGVALPGVYGGLTKAERLAIHRSRGVPTPPGGVRIPWAKSGVATRHGSWGAYMDFGCRCEACVATGREVMRKRKAGDARRTADARARAKV